MSDSVIITTIISVGVLLVVLLLGLLTSTTGEPTILHLLRVWEKIRLAKIEAKAKVDAAKQLHEKVCPRTTDPPRGGNR